MTIDVDNSSSNLRFDPFLDRQLTKITRPDGQLIQYIYDPQIGRLDHISLPFNGQISCG